MDSGTSPKTKKYSPTNAIKRSRQKLITDYRDPTNRFQLLTDEGQEADTPVTRNIVEKPPRMLLIMISSVHDYKVMTTELDSIAKDKYTIKVNGDKIKLIPTEIDNYHSIIKLLKAKNVQHHTYQLKQDKPFRVVIKNLHYILTKKTKTELENKGFEVVNIHTPIIRITKKPLSMHFVDL